MFNFYEEMCFVFSFFFRRGDKDILEWRQGGGIVKD